VKSFIDTGQPLKGPNTSFVPAISFRWSDKCYSTMHWWWM